MSTGRYAIIGTGALGAYYGARLFHSGRDVHFLLHSDFDHVTRSGLRVVSEKHGDFSIARPQVYARAQDMPRCDVVLVALKTTANHTLKNILPHVVSDRGVVLVMQNGLGIESDVAQIVGAERVIGGLAFLCSNKVGPGDIVHLDYGQVRLGEHAADNQPRGITPRLEAVGEDFRAAGIPVDLEEDLILARWKKLVWNVPYNGLTVVLRATTDQLMKDPAARALCEALMWEVVAGAAAQGRRIDPQFVQTMMDYTDAMVPYLPSMRLDYDANRPIEVEAIYGNPVRAAGAAGVPLPRTQTLYQQLKFMGANRPKHTG